MPWPSSSAGRRPLLRLSLCLSLAAAAAAISRFSPPVSESLPGSGRSGPIRVRRVRYLMGTVLEIDAVGRRGVAGAARTEDAVASAFSAVTRVEERLSNWKRGSELSRANRDAALGPVALSPETFRSLSAALALAAETDGAFDPTVGAVTGALGLMGGPAALASAAARASAVGYRFARLDDGTRTLSFARPGVAIDSGAFGKGEALDRAAAALARGNVEAARLNFGGQIRIFGAATPAGRERGFDRVAVAAPDLSGRTACRVVVADGSLSTSGDAEKPGHLIDPRTGRAAAFHGSASAFADTALRADALSTALFVLGPDQGIAFADREGIPALFLSSAAGIARPRASRAWRAMPSWTAAGGRTTPEAAP